MLLNGGQFSEADYFRYTHFSDTEMTDREIGELPKVWVVGGDVGKCRAEARPTEWCAGCAPYGCCRASGLKPPGEFDRLQ